jgi:thioesterase domain-containing protein/acyl carrier protein
MVRDGFVLQKELDRLGITVMQATPATWKLLLSTDWLGSAGLKILCGGEALSGEIAHRLRQRGEALWNLYGPTETTIWSSLFSFEPENSPASEGTVYCPIGRPIANTRLYILDRDLQPVPIGVSGELYIGGDGLARGYLNRPELTAEKFIPDPFSDDPNDRLYRTGDLVRYLPDGNIEYIGRSDHQVKIRGFRIEIGEIESVLCQHPGIAEVTVIAREDKPGDRRLVAYFVPGTGEPNAGQLRDFLKATLPDYMIPAAFVPLESLPLTPNGKVDRKALPSPDGLALASGGEHITPRSESEKRLAALWAEVLGREAIGIRNNFFDLGGNSLSAVRLMNRIEREFERTAPLSLLFQNPTIETLASALHDRSAMKWSCLVPLSTEGTGEPLFLVHPVMGHIFSFLDLARSLKGTRPIYALQALGLSGTDAPHTSIEDMAAYYLQEIKTVQLKGPYYLVGWSLGGLIAYEMASQLERSGESIAFLGLLDTGKPDDEESASPPPIEGPDFWLGWFGSLVPVSREDLQELDEERRLLYVFEQAKQVELFRERFNLEQFRLMTEVYRVGLLAYFQYRPPSLTSTVTLFRSEEESSDLTHESWRGLLKNNLRIVSTPGDHHQLVYPPHVDVLAEKMRRFLA